MSSILSYTIEIPSAMYRYVSGSKKADIVFKDRNRVISYPVTSERGLRLAQRCIAKGSIHITQPKKKNKNKDVSAN